MSIKVLPANQAQAVAKVQYFLHRPSTHYWIRRYHELSRTSCRCRGNLIIIVKAGVINSQKRSSTTRAARFITFLMIIFFTVPLPSRTSEYLSTNNSVLSILVIYLISDNRSCKNSRKLTGKSR